MSPFFVYYIYCSIFLIFVHINSTIRRQDKTQLHKQEGKEKKKTSVRFNFADNHIALVNNLRLIIANKEVFGSLNVLLI